MTVTSYLCDKHLLHKHPKYLGREFNHNLTIYSHIFLFLATFLAAWDAA